MTQTPSQIKSRLFTLLNKGIKYDLDRMVAAAARCGDPQKAYAAIHVAGTNGKGSTCAFIESILRRAGYKTGLYTSPHIVDFEERFKINNVDIDEQTWFDVYKSQEDVIEEFGLTFFEAATLMSFEIFKRAKVDYAIFETGMGGRLDATNIIAPQVCVITKLAMDHQEYLGNDIVTIAGEKLGIVKAGVPLVMLEPDYCVDIIDDDGGATVTRGHAPLSEEIKKLAGEKCRSLNAPLTFVNVDDVVSDIVTNDDGVSFVYDNEKYDLSLHGNHQIQNALLAMTSVKNVININRDVIKTALKETNIRARFQIVDVGGQTVILDVAHNPNAAQILVDTLNKRFPNFRVLFVVGIMKDKDVGATIDILSQRASAFYFAKLNTERAANPNELCELALTARDCGKFSGKVVVCGRMKDAFKYALDNAVYDKYGSDDFNNDKNKIVCVCGSFFTVAEVISNKGGVAVC